MVTHGGDGRSTASHSGERRLTTTHDANGLATLERLHANGSTRTSGCDPLQRGSRDVDFLVLKLGDVDLGEGRSIKSLCWRPDGKVIAVGLEDGTILLHDVENGKLLRSLKSHEVVWTKMKSSQLMKIALAVFSLLLLQFLECLDLFLEILVALTTLKTHLRSCQILHISGLTSCAVVTKKEASVSAYLAFFQLEK
ncbi:anaphase-promoting complex subunit 4 [Cucumis melo var. makuwa]|uniref:Anaphase-promoting complex subunit 4 n=1 Tax=Cucumis melo var. makuwa TaxID=1194695 RepID=A0A5D3C2N0_CUCMM|nr:anaphase-promoting complex subunit 4 [Cucumis melo var. makuwa]